MCVDVYSRIKKKEKRRSIGLKNRISNKFKKVDINTRISYTKYPDYATYQSGTDGTKVRVPNNWKDIMEYFERNYQSMTDDDRSKYFLDNFATQKPSL